MKDKTVELKAPVRLLVVGSALNSFNFFFISLACSLTLYPVFMWNCEVGKKKKESQLPQMKRLQESKMGLSLALFPILCKLLCMPKIVAP